MRRGALEMLRRRSTAALIEDMSSGRAEPDQGAVLSCLPLCDEPQSDFESDRVFEGLAQLSDVEHSREADDAFSLGLWSSMSEDEVEDRDCHDTRLRYELEYFMDQSLNMLAPSPPVVRPSEPASPEIPLRLETLPPPWSPRVPLSEIALPDRTAVSPMPNLLQRLLSMPVANIDTIRKRKRGGKRRGSGLFFQPNLYVVQRSLGMSATLNKLVVQDGIPHLKRKHRLRVKVQ